MKREVGGGNKARRDDAKIAEIRTHGELVTTLKIRMKAHEGCWVHERDVCPDAVPMVHVE